MTFGAPEERALSFGHVLIAAAVGVVAAIWLFGILASSGG